MHAAGHQVITRPLRRGAGHKRSLDFKEALAGEILPDGQRNLMAQFDVELHLLAAQVDVAVFEAHLFIQRSGFAG